MMLNNYTKNNKRDYEKVSIGSFKVKGGFEKWSGQKFSQYYLTPTEDKEGKLVLHFANLDENERMAEDKSFRVKNSSQVFRFQKELMRSLGMFVGIEGKNAPYFFDNIMKAMKKEYRKGVRKGRSMKKKYDL